ncbi:MAG: stage IV sporulation protein A [Bacillales bacterium]|nr:stage IV sporulation protein A [Bacillales bacterium]
MEDSLSVLKQIGKRNNGDIYLGVVGPVRVGKSTFIKKFMETLVIDNIELEEDKKRAIDELPQSGDGKTIMTVEPKFVPSNAISIKVDDDFYVKIRMIDCVGYIIEDASGYMEEGKMRMIKTPWFADSIPFDEAAKIGTQKVIKDHSTLGIVILSDGSINDFSRNNYQSVEETIINDVKNVDKPFVIILNTKTPHHDDVLKMKEEISQKYQVPVIPLDIVNMNRDDASSILKEALYQYPISGIELEMPKWVASLDDEHYIKKSIKDSIQQAMDEAKIVKDVDKITVVLLQNEFLKEAKIIDVDTGSGICVVQLDVKDGLYEVVLEELVGCKIEDKSQLIAVLSQFVKAKKNYEKIGNALEMADSLGYGFASNNILKIEKPELSKVQGRPALKIKASTSCYHLIKVDLQTSFEPVLGNKEQADYFLDYLTKAYEEGEMVLLEKEMFGRKFKDIINESFQGKLNNLPEPVKIKLQQLIKTISNKGKGNLIAFVF